MHHALELLSDLVLHPTFTPEDIAREQGVILEEIKMDEDSPDYLVHETFTQNFWKGHALGQPHSGHGEERLQLHPAGGLRLLCQPLHPAQHGLLRRWAS